MQGHTAQVWAALPLHVATSWRSSRRCLRITEGGFWLSAGNFLSSERLSSAPGSFLQSGPCHVTSPSQQEPSAARDCQGLDGCNRVSPRVTSTLPEHYFWGEICRFHHTVVQGFPKGVNTKSWGPLGSVRDGLGKLSTSGNLQDTRYVTCTMSTVYRSI